METKEEFKEKLSEIGKKAFMVMEYYPDTRHSKYKLLWKYWRVHINRGFSFENDMVDGLINIEGIFTAQRKIWKFYPHWKKAKEQTKEKHDAYQEHKISNPAQGELSL